MSILEPVFKAEQRGFCCMFIVKLNIQENWNIYYVPFIVLDPHK